MSRPFKEGLDYFELDCVLDDKVKLVQAEYGLKGFAVIVKLLQKIYGQHGYYCEWNDDTLLLFMSENGLDGESKKMIKDIVKACIRRKIFSGEKFSEHQILTSAGIQKRYLNATSRRESVKLKKEFLLINVDQKYVSADINPINVDSNADRNEVSARRNPQRRVEKSREEKSRVENPSATVPAAPASPSVEQMIKAAHFSTELEAAVLEWLEYKIEQKRKYEPTGLKSLISRIASSAASAGDGPVIALIHDSMANNWAGIAWGKLDQMHQPANGNAYQKHHQRAYDWEKLEKQLLLSQERSGGS